VLLYLLPVLFLVAAGCAQISISVDGTIATVAGNKIAAYVGDRDSASSEELNQSSGLVLDNSGNLYIPDLSNNVVRKVSALTGMVVLRKSAFHQAATR
jgi:hypothetical protein